jgi:glycosyltransferase involved in cell wall biosynthesis
MKIAVVAPPYIKIPPDGYGGIETVAHQLTEGLISRGHNVTLFTIGESRSSAELYWVFKDEQRGKLSEEPSSFLNTAMTQTIAAYLEIDRRRDFDIVHDHTWKEGLASAHFLDIPVVHTVHSPMDEENKKFYRLFIDSRKIHFVSISKFQQKCLPGLNYAGNVYNAIELESFPFSEEKEDFLLWLGRFNEDKAPHLACEAAKILKKKLVLIGKLREEKEKEYFAEKVKPYLNDRIQYIGELAEERKKYFMSAQAFLNPIQWDEPFGLVLVEAMACGTPVVSFNRGSIPEIVKDGVTGFVVDTFDDFLDSIKRVNELKPKDLREYVNSNFSSEAMVNGYERVYENILGQQG